MTVGTFSSRVSAKSRLQHAMAMGSLPTATRIAVLGKRVAACEERLGGPALASAVLEPSLCSQLDDLTSKVDDACGQDKSLAEYQGQMKVLREWLQQEHAQDSHVLLHRDAKQIYVVQHAEFLDEFSQSVRKLQELESCIESPTLDELPNHSARLQRLEASSISAAGNATQLHGQVTQLAEDYHRAMVTLNAQLLQWDALLTERPKSC